MGMSQKLVELVEDREDLAEWVDELERELWVTRAVAALAIAWALWMLFH